MLKKMISAFFAVLLSGMALSACNTVHGVGQDVEAGGQKLQSEANEHR
jgi:predicted small secreted protein